MARGRSAPNRPDLSDPPQAAVGFQRPYGSVGTGRTLPPQMNAVISGFTAVSGRPRMTIPAGILRSAERFMRVFTPPLLIYWSKPRSCAVPKHTYS